MASTHLATSLLTGATAAAASWPLSPHTDPPAETTIGSGDTSTSPAPTPAQTPELEETLHATGSPTSVLPGTATRVPMNSILTPAASSFAATSASASRSSVAFSYSSGSSSLLSTSMASYSMASVTSSLSTPWLEPSELSEEGMHAFCAVVEGFTSSSRCIISSLNHR